MFGVGAGTKRASWCFSGVHDWAWIPSATQVSDSCLGNRSCELSGQVSSKIKRLLKYHDHALSRRFDMRQWAREMYQLLDRNYCMYLILPPLDLGLGVGIKKVGGQESRQHRTLRFGNCSEIPPRTEIFPAGRTLLRDLSWHTHAHGTSSLRPRPSHLACA